MVLPCVHLTMYVYGFVSAQDVLSPWGPRPSPDASVGLPRRIPDHNVMGFVPWGDGFRTMM